MTPYEEIDALNWSTLKHLHVSPRMLRWRADHPRPDTAALLRGRAIHCALFEPDRWPLAYIAQPAFGDMRRNSTKAERARWLASLANDETVVAQPYFDSRKKGSKAEKAVWVGSQPPGTTILVGDEDAARLLPAGVTVLPADEHALVVRCVEAIRAHPVAARMIRGGRVEEVVTWTDPTTGIACKARMDWISPRGVLDVKSTRHGTLRQIAADFAQFLYHGQLAWYHDGAIRAGVIPRDAELPQTIIVQTTEPFDVVPAHLGALDLDRGRQLYRSLLRRYVECQAAELWPGIAPDLIRLDLPSWAPSGDEEEGW